MTDQLQAALQAAIGPNYAIERELGGGGMSRVFVARDTSLDRRVVIKVLSPELAAGVSAERFRREIQVAARLQHPHIVPLLTAGQADELLYYTMPFVDGESLRARLAREGELPVAAAVRLLREVARALSYAHRHGIVHRDIKPDNILLAEDEAQVADFGIAKALVSSAESGGVTSAGLTLGTPAYMAPEQATGDAVDHRADLYALGCVGYEMLTGQPPFERRTPQAMLAAHVTETPPAVGVRRPGTPVGLDELVMRLLRKRPADRPQSADEVVRSLEGLDVSGARVTPAAAPPTVRVEPVTSSGNRSRWIAAGAVGALVVMIVMAAMLRRQPAPSAVDRHLVAVAPFRVTGADSGLGYLREGLTDLLSAKLSGTSETRSVDPRTVLTAWRRAARDGLDLPEADAVGVAARLGAGRLVLGEVVGDRRRLTINAALLETPGGGARVRTSVEGPVDSLPRLVDQLTAKLLALGAGEDERRLAGLTSTSLPALRAYIDGQALLRRGRFEEAQKKFDQALQLDSTFALAGLAFTAANEWLGGRSVNRGGPLAWRERDRLPSIERMRLDAYLGPRFPGPSNSRDFLDAAERFAAAAPENPEAWYKLADLLYHFGPLTGVGDANVRSRKAFARATALDSTFAPALEHGPQLAYELGDSAGIRTALSALLRVDSVSPLAAYQRLFVALVLGDSATVREALRQDSLGPVGLTANAVSQGVGTREAGEFLEGALGEAVTAEERILLENRLWAHLLHIGRPSQAQAALGDVPVADRVTRAALVGLFADGDSTAMIEAVRILREEVGRPVIGTDLDATIGRYAVGQYALEQGDTGLARHVVADLNSARLPRDSAWNSDIPPVLALVLRTELAARQGSDDAGQLLRELDSTLITGPGPATQPGNLIAARLHETRGDLPAALAAVRRRVFDLNDSPLYVTYAREEGRLAALTGDREGAMKAYRRYLALRIDPEPRLKGQVMQVRSDLEALERESADR